MPNECSERSLSFFTSKMLWSNGSNKIEPHERLTTLSANMSSTSARPMLDEQYLALSPRQKQVCDLVVEGLTSKAIAERLGTTTHTIKAHRAEVMRKLDVDSVAELVRTRVQSSAPAALAPHARDGAEPLRVAVVEDQALFRDLLVNSLLSFGHQAIGLPDGQQLDALFHSNPPDILILDVSLGCEETGLDIADRVRRISTCGIVFMSSHARLEDRMAALNRGADAYFVKPVSFVELNATLLNLSRRVR
jgi:DNA-binding NarL/FixJ family response regulator